MSTHIAAGPGEIAPKVLLPGDPLRAKFIAENFLTDSHIYSHIRNALGYTGIYRGEKISVQATGMGMPSIAIYAHELMKDYHVQQLVRVGTAGGLAPQLKVRNLVLAQAATTDSNMISRTFGAGMNFAPIADFQLLHKAYILGKQLKQPIFVGNILGQDQFYDTHTDYQQLIDYGILAAEMETPALYLLAAQFQRQALAILTISNHIMTGAETSAQARETSFADMARLGLGVLGE